MSNHIIGYEDLMKYFTVMDQKRETDELRNYCASSRPGLYWFTRARLDLLIDLGEQFLVNVRPFFERSSHKISLTLKARFEVMFQL